HGGGMAVGVASSAVAHGASALFWIAQAAEVQVASPDAMRSRILVCSRLLLGVSATVGVLVFGALFDVLGADRALTLQGLLVVAFAALVWRAWTPRDRTTTTGA